MNHRSIRFVMYATAVVSTLSMIAFAQTGAVNLTGTWIFTVETTAGAGVPTITLRQDGEKLAGHYSGQLGEADLGGSVKGQEIAFTFTVDVQGMKLLNTYTGRIESNDALKGSVDIAGLAGGTFTAKRK